MSTVCGILLAQKFIEVVGREGNARTFKARQGAETPPWVRNYRAEAGNTTGPDLAPVPLVVRVAAVPVPPPAIELERAWGRPCLTA